MDPPSSRRAIDAHRARWGTPDRVVRAPGRVNLIGDHTDHQDGFCLPMALPFDTVIAISDTDDGPSGPVAVWSEGFGEATWIPAADPAAVPVWARHLAGVTHLAARDGIPSGGWRACITSDIPSGAGLSSSAAIEVATITALTDRAGVRWTPLEVARLGRRVEHEVVGVACGIMDQLISAGAVGGHASLLDARAQTLSPVRLPDGVTVVVIDTGTRRTLADGAYDDRRRACEQAAAALGVETLRDATMDALAEIGDAVLRRRARHVVGENERTLATVEALAAGDLEAAGRLLAASHVSLRDDFEVTSDALDRVTALAMGAPGCLGARMTGGGFAGCVVALVRTGSVPDFADAVRSPGPAGVAVTGVWPCSPAAGAGPLESIP